MKTATSRFFQSFTILVSTIVLFSTISCDGTNPAISDNTTGLLQSLTEKPNAQQLDSLFQIALDLPNDSVKVDILISIYKKTIRQRPIRSDILDTALFFAQNLNYIKGIAIAYNRKGINKRYDLKYRESVDLHKQSLRYFNKTTDTLGKLKCLNSLGVSLRRLNNEREAMKYYLEALKLAEAIKHSKSIAVALNGIGNVFVNIEQYNNALPYFKKALELEIKAQNKKGMNYGLSNIGEVFMFLNKNDSALYYYSEALTIAKELNYKDNESINYNCIGHLYQQMGDFKKSNEQFNLAIPKLKKYNGKRYLSNTFINLGMNYTELGEYNHALKHIERGISIAQEINSPENIILGFEALSLYYEKMEFFNLALENFKKNITLRDSINNEHVKRNIASLESVYENELKDKEIKNYQYQESLQENQNILQWTIIIFLVLLVSSLIVFYRLRQKNNRLALIQMRNDIQEYVHRIEKYEHKPEEDEKTIFYKNVKQYGLSEREIDVLLLISKGLRNEEIAEKLFVSLSTIKTHTRNIFVKLDVRNRIEAARKTQII